MTSTINASKVGGFSAWTSAVRVVGSMHSVFSPAILFFVKKNKGAKCVHLHGSIFGNKTHLVFDGAPRFLFVICSQRFQTDQSPGNFMKLPHVRGDVQHQNPRWKLASCMGCILNSQRFFSVQTIM